MKNKIIPSISLVCAIFFLNACTKNPDKKPSSETTTVVDSSNPLPSWNDGETKKAIIDFVTQATDKESPNFIPEADRIATFDNDGTLWAEKPLIQELFAFFMVNKLVKKNPALAQKQPFKAVIEKDKTFFEKGGEKAILELVWATHTGMTEDEFEEAVKEFSASAKHPKTNLPIKNMTYKPQIELLEYLRSNGFKTFICTGGTIEFVRGISQDFYGIPKEDVIGTSFQYEFNDSTNTIYRNQKLVSFNDKQVKPTNIQLHIGKKPVFACGNEGAGGDIAMLEYSQTSKYPSFQLLVNHNDPKREFSYQEKDNASLNMAAKNKWHVISMKDDWKEVFVK